MARKLRWRDQYLTPEAFNDYRPIVFASVTEEERNLLVPWIPSYLETLDDQSYMVLLLFFVLRLDNRMVRAVSKAKYTRGIVELFRYFAKNVACRTNDVTISNGDLHDIFVAVVQDSDVVLVTGGRGFCLFRHKIVPESLALDAAAECSRRKAEIEGAAGS